MVTPVSTPPFYLYHGCCMLTNQIAQLEVGNFHTHLPRGGYFLPKAILIHVLLLSGHGTSQLHHSVSVSTRLTLPRAAPPRDITYT